jgi:hypothetical protein
LKYVERVYGLSELIRQVRDARKGAVKYATDVAARGLFVMLVSRTGSLHSFEQNCGGGFAKGWVDPEDGAIPKADQLGRIAAVVNASGARLVNRGVLRHLKRNKGMRRRGKETMVFVIMDGHEMFCSYRKKCPRCLERTIHMTEGDKIQYYHRNVTAMLVWEDNVILLDAEMQEAGEDEVACAVRCLERVIRDYGRSFDAVMADSLYARAPFFKLCLKHGKEVIAVLKDERREVMKDALGLMERMTPDQWEEDGKVFRCWDLEGFESWDAMDRPVRVVRTVETKLVKRQINKKMEIESSEWCWVTTISKEKLSGRGVVTTGHRRWAIENEGFNELVNEWKADHLYKHDANAMLVIWLFLFIAYNLFHAFIRLNLKPQIRVDKTIRYWAEQIKADFLTWPIGEIIPNTS